MKKPRNLNRVTLKCAVCSNEFTVTESRMLNKNPKYCSRACQAAAYRKPETPKRAYRKSVVEEEPESQMEWRKPLPLFGTPK